MPMAKDYKFFVNKVKLTSASQFITGLQIKEMAHGENGAYPPTKRGSIHPLVSRKSA